LITLGRLIVLQAIFACSSISYLLISAWRLHTTGEALSAAAIGPSISSGPIEGTNNKIKTLKRQAYGYRDTELFKLRIMGIHEAKYALAG
jgi:transposase